ncbi:hypothetical protein CICLE_v10023222mg [Citrus x clementina]|uniref:Uncharacterized protein n=1 Tax=Citrus clementina TaxID=85681 RepID=V4T6N5_CITCL|nr:hypothetical protein CICLE_v10023222mg [Citrus x clementina]
MNAALSLFVIIVSLQNDFFFLKPMKYLPIRYTCMIVVFRIFFFILEKPLFHKKYSLPIILLIKKNIT